MAAVYSLGRFFAFRYRSAASPSGDVSHSALRSAPASTFTSGLLGSSASMAPGLPCGWRMQRATRLQRSQRVSVSQVASQVGYEAQAAFSRAFKRSIGVAPALYK